MSRLNTGSKLITAPMKTEPKPSGKTHEGGPGFLRDPRTELFMRATTVFAGEGTFYEKGDQSDARMIALARQLAVEDWPWLAQFLPWLRLQGNIRTSSVMLAAEAAHARAEAKLHGYLWNDKGTDFFTTPTPPTTRKVVDLVLQRGDEPTEMIQYCLKTWGKIPMAVRRGVSDAMTRLWGERSVIRYDKPERPLRFADAIELIHPDPKAEWQSDLFRYLLDERHHPGGKDKHGNPREIPASLPAITLRKAMSKLPPADRHSLAAEALRDRGGVVNAQLQGAAAGQWEWIMSWLGEGVTSATEGDGAHPLTERQRWSLVIPWMGYMAVLRNLRNFDQAGLAESMASKVAQRLADRDEVASSRQLPFRFLTAWLNAPSVRWGNALEQALQASLPNVPELSGHTLIMVDTSGSMTRELSVREQRPLRPGQKPPVRPKMVQAAALFALALALRNPRRVDVVGFASPPGPGCDGNFLVQGIEPGASLLRLTEMLMNCVGMVGTGTAIEQNLRKVFDSGRHDRVVIFSDEQTIKGGPNWDSYRASWLGIGDVTTAIPASVPMYAWNLGGYSYGAMATGSNRYCLSGLTDASFGIMQRIENGQSAKWPWEMPELAHAAVLDEDDDE